MTTMRVNTRRTKTRRLLAAALTLTLAAAIGGCDVPDDKANIALGPDSSTTQQVAHLILNEYGIKDTDYHAHSMRFEDALEGIETGSIDISMAFLGLPTSSIASLQAATGDVTLLSLSDDVITRIENNSDYHRFTISKDSYNFLTKDVHTLAAYAVLMANTHTINNEMGYQLAKIMYEKTGQLPHAQSRFMTLNNALNGGQNLQIHPGAKRFYEEQGLTVNMPEASLDGVSAKREFIFGTGSQGGTYYPLGGELTTLWNKQLPSINITNVATQASIENLHGIAEDKIDLGMAVHVSAYEAQQGMGEFANAKVGNAAFIGQLYPEVFQIVARTGNRVSAFTDIKTSTP
ncbi:TAXI family TRAP transporter solute-binding subunit [Oceanisphaera sp.]|uniref:TAXI family TRAP transporter solute-binding subunit n=1 Tax=Oceanisphaera sp. TaxID=1929979 RepID=UPI003A9513EB